MDEREQSPTSPQFQLTGPPCKYNDLRKFARDLFGASSSESGLAQQMSGEPANSAAATNLGFDLMAAIAAKRDGAGGLTSTEIENAANLVIQIIRCANVNVIGVNSLSAYSQALGASGAFQVRGGTSTAGVADAAGPVLSLDAQAGVQAPGNDFGAWLGGRVLVYGYPTSPFSGEQTGAAAGLSGTITYEWSLVASTGVTLPRPTKGKFSQCVVVENDDDFTRLRVQKTSNILETVSAVPGLQCLNTVARAGGELAPRTLGERLTRLFAPAPLHAAAVAKGGSPTGSAGSFSPFQVGNPQELVMRFSRQPRDGTQNQPLEPFAVEIKGQAGTVWTGVLVEVFALNNNGATVEATGTLATTNDQGIATFSEFTVNKTGAYRLLAVTVSSDPDVEGFVPDSVESRKINVRP